MRTKFKIVLIAILFLPTTASREAAAWQLTAPIVTYFGQNTSYPNSTVQQTLQYDADGGYNLVWSSDTITLQVAKNKGMKGLQVDPAFWQYHSGDLNNSTKKAYIDGQINYLGSFQGLFGYYLGDEYPASNFAAMGEISDYIKAHDPNHATYANISGLPGEITSQQQVTDYQTYLNQFLTTVRPSIFSYDYYQMNNNFSGTTYVGKADLNGYLMNLGIVSTAAHQAGIPFMNVVQAGRWNAGWRTPNANELRFLVYSTLAYGAQGISYFNWYSSYTAPSPGQPYYNGSTSVGMIQPTSWNPLTPTDVYTALTPLNGEYMNVAKKLQTLDYIGTYVKGYATSPTYAGPPGTSPLLASSPFSLTGTGNAQYHEYDLPTGALLGLFGTDGTALSNATFALVENMDYSNSHTYTVTGPGNLSTFDATSGKWTSLGQNSVALNLLAGGGVLVGLTSEILPAGDFNLDGHVTSSDIQAMMQALGDLSSYKSSKGLSAIDLLAVGDVNHDGQVSNADLQGLIGLLKSGGGSVGVPEPSSLVLLILGTVAFYKLRVCSKIQKSQLQI